MTTVPWAGLVWLVTVRPTPRSLASTVEPFRGVLAEVVPVSLPARAPTVTDTVAVVVCPAASMTV